MNKKLKRYLDEAEKTEAKIQELQDYLKSVRAAQKQEEDLEMVRSLRSLKLSGHDLFSLLNGIQDGTVTILRNSTDAADEAAEPGQDKAVPEDAPESEDNENE